MIKSNFNNIEIVGIASAVPNNIVRNDSYYEKFGKEAVDKFIAMAGVHETHIAVPEQTASDLAFVAAKKILDEQKIPTEKIGILIFVTQTPDYRVPATAMVLHKRLELSKDCIVFDINLGCSGFVFGMHVVSSLLQTTNTQYAMLVMGDTGSKISSADDRGSVMLFGDSGSAVLVEKRENSAPMHMSFMSDGSGFKSIIIPSGAFRNMNGSHEPVLWGDGNIRSDYHSFVNGTEVFNFTMFDVPPLIKAFMAENMTTTDDYDGVILHQANVFILKQLSKKLKFPWEKIPVSMDRFGNTSVCSIPLTLCDAYANKDIKNIFALMCGFGVGLSWGVIDAHIDTNNIYPIIYTDEYYTDGGVNHD